MTDSIKLSCGCELTFSDSYPHLIIKQECGDQAGGHRTFIHSQVSEINGILDVMDARGVRDAKHG